MDLQRRVDELRGRSGELENHVIDELTAGRLSRRDFVSRAAVAGLSASAVGAILAACGGANTSSSGTASGSTTSAGPGKRGGTLRLAQQVPATAMNPLLVSDAGGLNILGQSGEYLVFNNNATLRLEPQLALRWSPNDDASVWTFHLRPGVKFNDGATMTADDVVWTIRELSDPKNASNALSNFSGVLTPAGVRKVDAHTVAFHLQGPNGNFPFLVSSDNYNAIIVPKGTDWSKWHTTFVGTGPWRIKSYQQTQSASFIANPTYWGPKPMLDGVTYQFYMGQQPQVFALQGGQVDGVSGAVAQGAQSILKGGEYTIITRKSSGHREISMRTDRAPFTDARVRRALALCIDRPGLVQGVLSGYAELGNDSPFAPRFASTDRSVPQRKQDIAQAKQLLAAAGHPRGFHAVYTSEQIIEMPVLAQAVQADARKAGIDLSLKIEQQSTYYGKATFGNSDWLDSTISASDYGDRGEPNTFLQAPLVSHGVWNAAHFSDPTYDRLVREYVRTPDLHSQRRTAGAIERLLLEQTPLIIAYFIDGLTVTKKNVQGTNPSSNGAIFVGGASFT